MDNISDTFTSKKEMERVREGGKDYIVIRGGQADGLSMQMLLNNKIEGLLPLSIREFNGEIMLYYDVSGRSSFYEMFDGENDIMERDDVEKICKSFVLLSETLRDYLLDSDEVNLSVNSMYYNPETALYEFLYLPSSEASEPDRGDDNGEESSFNAGVKEIFDRVMEKFNHQSELPALSRVYDIYQKVSMPSFDPEEVFAPVKEKEVVRDRFSKEVIREAMTEPGADETAFVKGGTFDEEENAKTGQEDVGTVEKTGGGLFEKLNLRLAGSAGILSGKRNEEIESIARSMDDEEKLSYKVKSFLQKNAKSLFRASMVMSVLFLIFALLPSSFTFKPPVSVCVALFLVCAVTALYTGKLCKEKSEAIADI